MEFKTFDLGLVDYKIALDFQKDTFEKVKGGYLNSALILYRHNPVITLGRGAKKENILVSEDELRIRGIGLYKIERGGEVTYHGPGQITVYPIFNLSFFKKDIHLFLRNLEQVVIDFLMAYGICGLRRKGFTGVWIGEKKIASIGIAVKNWITFHGLSVNIKKGDLDNFNFIRPCGMDIKMTSLEDALGREVEIDNLKTRLINKFKEGLYANQGSFA